MKESNISSASYGLQLLSKRLATLHLFIFSFIPFDLLFLTPLCIFKSMQPFSKALWQFIRNTIKLCVCFDPKIIPLDN